MATLIFTLGGFIKCLTNKLQYSLNVLVTFNVI